MTATTGNLQKDKQGLPIINRAWASQARWDIDAINGDDQNDGNNAANLGTALKTWAELRRRMQAVGGHTVADVNIYIYENFPDSDVICPDWGTFGNLPVHIIGVPKVARSSSMTGLVARNQATNQAVEMTDSSVSSWTSELSVNSGKILKMVTGDAAGSYAWMAKNLGSNTVRLSPLWDVNIGETIQSDGEQYEILSLPFIRNYCLTPNSGFFLLKLLDLGDQLSTQYSIAPAIATAGCQLTYCAIYNVYLSNTTLYLANCCVKTPLSAFNATLQLYAGMVGNKNSSGWAYTDGEIETAAELILADGALHQGIRLNIINNGYVRAVDAQFYDSGDNAIAVGTFGKLRITSLAGSGNTLHGLSIANSGTVIGDLSNCFITGTVGDVDFCTVLKSWSTLQGLGYLKSTTSMASIGPL